MKHAVVFPLVVLVTTVVVVAQDPDPVTISPNMHSEYLGTFDVATMSEILTREVPRVLEGIVTYTASRNAVKLYRVTYSSVVPEQSNRPTLASGILAIPATGAQIMPLISYQHGTLYGDMAPPSDHERSCESRLMVSQFASQGYALISADYFGFGVSKEKDSSIVLGRQVQASYDMYRAALMVLEREGTVVSRFFVSG